MVAPVQRFINTGCETVLHTAASAGIGYLLSRAFNIIDPVHGAVFSGVSYLVSKVVNPLFGKVFSRPDSNEASKAFGAILSIGVGVAASAAISTFVGFPISILAGVVLTCALVATRILAQVAITLVSAVVEA